MRYLVLNLAGVMQYYAPEQAMAVAVSSSYYKTEKKPTKNAVIGMIGGALGYPRRDTRILKLYNSLDIKYKTKKTGGILTDFQTIRPMNGMRFAKVGGGTEDKTIIKKIEYLQDYAFTVYVGADEEMLHIIYEAFCNPVYATYLGRRSCIPSEPIVHDYNTVSGEELENVYDCP